MNWLIVPSCCRPSPVLSPGQGMEAGGHLGCTTGHDYVYRTAVLGPDHLSQGVWSCPVLVGCFPGTGLLPPSRQWGRAPPLRLSHSMVSFSALFPRHADSERIPTVCLLPARGLGMLLCAVARQLLAHPCPPTPSPLRVQVLLLSKPCVSLPSRGL